MTTAKVVVDTKMSRENERAAIFQQLERAFEETSTDPDQTAASLLISLEASLGTGIVLKEAEKFRLITEFVAAKMIGSMEGGITSIPEIGQMEGWLLARVHSWVWFYITRRVHSYGRPLFEDLIKRGHFDLDNNDSETIALLRWCDQNPGKVAALFTEMVEKRFRKNAENSDFAAKVRQDHLALVAEF